VASCKTYWARDGNGASIAWRFDPLSYHGIPTTLIGREEFLFDDGGLILKAVAHWQPGLVARQWQRQGTNQDAETAAAGPAHSYIASLRPKSGPYGARSVTSK
jgi:hypothetical protein